jgi:hypothetical protein
MSDPDRRPLDLRGLAPPPDAPANSMTDVVDFGRDAARRTMSLPQPLTIGAE